MSEVAGRRPSMPTPHSHLRASFPARPEAASDVRAWAAAALRDVGHEVPAELLLLLTELVSNAIKHTRGQEFVVEIDVDSRVVTAVYDDDPRPPAPAADAGIESSGGRGLHLVDRLADQWGAELYRDGKCVWFSVGGEAST